MAAVRLSRTSVKIKDSLITGTIFSFSLVNLVTLWNNCDDDLKKLTLKLKKLFRNKILNCYKLRDSDNEFLYCYFLFDSFG